ncbi:hypothetical protein [Desulfosarcina ovata]|uniref:hypothetical protein n=1 Tax=Desulfosarcina ovata TaxID=83564 RepID=UPI001E37E3D0|nr:hypothetical protein [Desulfosarcina ovata]
MRSLSVIAKLMNSKRLMALFIKSGGSRFDLPLIKSCCVSLSANDFIMKISVNCHVTDVNVSFQLSASLQCPTTACTGAQKAGGIG